MIDSAFRDVAVSRTPGHPDFLEPELITVMRRLRIRGGAGPAGTIAGNTSGRELD
ncbi:hypothetical protein [Micromonospora tarensis]|uniref:Uncharacterized protein n=1 Tax=Micromonospora tarensis TaxID=2806100 RepID=A0ABS1YQ03_9ACTN|nr:hypothetical protein [Micromonospora tarensis]MBM0279525.1 hypothetical protein [Micromonospora tarensis]